MTICVFAIRDTKVGFGNPFADQTAASAIRGFEYSLTKADGIVGFAPSDYELYELGSFDTDSGALTALPQPKFLVGGANLD